MEIKVNVHIWTAKNLLHFEDVEQQDEASVPTEFQEEAISDTEHIASTVEEGESQQGTEANEGTGVCGCVLRIDI